MVRHPKAPFNTFAAGVRVYLEILHELLFSHLLDGP